MVKQHLKRIATPKTWNILRKSHTFITRPDAGAHAYTHATSLNTALKELIGLTRTTKETKRALHEKEVLVDGKRRHDERFNVGFMDVISIPSTKQHYRLGFTEKGKLTAFDIPEKEAGLKLTRVVGKQHVKGGKIQVQCNDGRNLKLDKADYTVGDSLLITVPGQEVKQHLPLKEGASVTVYKGKHTGAHGVIKKLEGDSVEIETPEGQVNTSRAYAYVTGEKKPAIKCSR
ncbi:MAG: 30S ribosomal protein S4e [Candidatus Woesearchaeota archaeon]